MKRTITKIIPAEEITVNATVCDICEREVPYEKIPLVYTAYRQAASKENIVSNLFNVFGRWGKREDIADTNPLVEVNSFEVHYECAVKAISEAIEQQG